MQNVQYIQTRLVLTQLQFPFATVHRIENNSDNSEQNDDETDDELPELDGYQRYRCPAVI